MTPKLQVILDQIQQAENISADEKEFLRKAILDADKGYAMVQFKLDRILCTTPESDRFQRDAGPREFQGRGCVPFAVRCCLQVLIGGLLV